MADEKVLKIYVADGCKPCEEIKELAEAGKMLTNVGADTDIHLVDVTSDEGFPEIEREKLTGVPVAKYDGRTCKLSIDEETKTLIIDCQEELKADPPASPEAISAPPAAPADSTPAVSGPPASPPAPLP
jgi:hypothetical protein